MKTRSTTNAPITVITAIALIWGCRTTPTPAESEPVAQLKPFVLFVCNQSLAISPIDIQVEIDGEVVVKEDFEVGRQLNWKTFNLKLSPGKHMIKMSSEKGGAQLSEEFTVTSEHGASVQYWYYPESHVFATPRHFRFALLSGPAPGI